MKDWQKLAVAATISTAFSGIIVADHILSNPNYTTKLAELVKERGTRFGVNYTVEEKLEDGSAARITFVDIGGNGSDKRDRLEIRVVRPYSPYSGLNHFGYLVVDESLDGMQPTKNLLGDEFRQYLGDDRWNSFNLNGSLGAPLDGVVRAGLPTMYEQLVKELYGALKR